MPRSPGNTTTATACRSCTRRRTSRRPERRRGGHWLWKEWANVLRVRNVGIPTVGFTWYSLTDQVDWDTALREQNGNVNPLGLYDLDRNIRAVGRGYKTDPRLARGSARPERLPAAADHGAT